MGANKPALWMVVDLEEEELPLYVARNAQDVADWAGTSRESVMSSISHARERDGKSKFVRIYLDDDDEILQMEREGKLIGTKEIADYIGIAGTTIRRHRDEMPIYKENGAVIADKDAVDAWLADPPDWFAACKK